MPESRDKTECCVSFIIGGLDRLRAWDGRLMPTFVGLNGAQGSGKSTLASSVAEKLRKPPYKLPTIVLSIDDLYLTHELQSKLASSHPSNPLIQHRGQPSTHDLPLALSLLEGLRTGKETRVPSYDKSAFNGQGDRTPQETWQTVNGIGQPAIKVVIFEGWCVGFRALSEQELKTKWESAVGQREEGNYHGRLGFNRLEDVGFINDALKGYDQLTDQLDVLIHLDAADPFWVYEWREEQEQALRATKGSGMTTEQVKHFVDGYYPAYELFTDRLRTGIFGRMMDRQLRLVIGKDRRAERMDVL